MANGRRLLEQRRQETNRSITALRLLSTLRTAMEKGSKSSALLLLLIRVDELMEDEEVVEEKRGDAFGDGDVFGTVHILVRALREVGNGAHKESGNYEQPGASSSLEDRSSCMRSLSIDTCKLLQPQLRSVSLPLRSQSAQKNM